MITSDEQSEFYTILLCYFIMDQVIIASLHSLVIGPLEVVSAIYVEELMLSLVIADWVIGANADSDLDLSFTWGNRHV